MDHPPPEAASRFRVVVPALIAVWIFGSGLLWIVGTGDGGGDAHHESVLVTDIRIAAAQAAVGLSILGPLVIAVLEFVRGKHLIGVVFLAIGTGLGVLLLGSDAIVGLFKA